MSWRLFPISEFAAHAGAWGDFNAQTLRSPALEPGFVAPLIDCFSSGREQLAVRERDGRVDAMALVAPAGAGRWETFHPSQAPVGLWLQRDGDAADALAGELIAALPGPVVQLALNHLDPALVPRPADGARCRTLDYIRTARVAATGSFEEYWAARGKNLRSNVRKQTNRLSRAGTEPAMTVLDTPEGIARGVRHYAELEAAGWKSERGSAVTPGGDQERFYAAALSALATAPGCGGMAYLLHYGEDLVAVDLCVKAHGTGIVLKTTYDERINDTSPALLLRHRYFQALFEAGDVERVEFYGPVMEWHTKWSDDIRTLYHLNVYASRLAATAHGVLRSLRAGGDAVDRAD